MSITRRIIDLAKSNLNNLLDRAAEHGDPKRKLEQVTDAELEAELARRKTARAGEQRVEDAKDRVSGDRAEREKAARDRAERVRAAKERAARARGAGTGAGPGAGTGTGTGAGTGAGAGPGSARGRFRDPELTRYYERLELPYGADFEQVKAQYRKLMRKYHPDMHANKTPEKVKAAHEVSAALTQAYNELEKVLQKK